MFKFIIYTLLLLLTVSACVNNEDVNKKEDANSESTEHAETTDNFLYENEERSIENNGSTPIDETIINEFENLDVDGNGQLDKKEIATTPELEEKLSILDIDEDGAISWGEYQIYRIDSMETNDDSY